MQSDAAVKGDGFTDWGPRKGVLGVAWEEGLEPVVGHSKSQKLTSILVTSFDLREYSKSCNADYWPFQASFREINIHAC